MWNPKRVALLLVGFVLFAGVYFGYAYVLGGIDGLPPLPPALQPSRDGTVALDVGPPPAPLGGSVDDKLKQAFGLECVQLKKTIKFEYIKKGLVLACDDHHIEADGRIKLSQFNAALFSKKATNGFPEITTVTCKEAFLQFDQPIASLTDLGARKIVGGELRGDIVIINNRMTEKKEDDIEVRIDGEPLFYSEPKALVWTDGRVKLLDTQTKPEPTMVVGKGLELHLSKETPAQDAIKHKNKNALVGGIDLVVLRSSVVMHLYPDARDGFLGGDTQKARTQAAKKSAEPTEKAHVTISTGGPFRYDLVKDVATFDSPPLKAGLRYPDRVVVMREALKPRPEDKTIDQLDCDHLTLRFRKKTNAKGPKDQRGADREIESALATSLANHNADNQVVLTLDRECLSAGCTELLYDCATADTGPRTTLKGEKLWVLKDNHKILARELMLVGNNAEGQGQRVVAKGPGMVNLYKKPADGRDARDRDPHEEYTIHALWRDLLVTGKEHVGDKVLDVLTLTGDAAFVDKEHDQQLSGQHLQLWLEPSPVSVPPPSAKQANGTTSKQRPVKVMAYQDVKAHAPDMNISDCVRFTILFTDSLETPPAAAAVSQPTGTTSQKPVVDVDPVPQGAVKPIDPLANLAVAPELDRKTRKPINLKARDVTAYVTRTGAKNDLRELVAEGDVHVVQDPEPHQDKGTDIKGEQLTLIHQKEGDILEVFGDSRGPAQLQLRELILVGPKVQIDQAKNLAKVDGMGAMNMPSKTTLDGGVPSRPDARLTIHWSKDMLFTGQDAFFSGNVVAYQDNSSLKCQNLEVALDKPVNFRDGQKDKQGAKVKSLVGSGKVYIVDTVRDKEGQLKRYQRLIAHEIAANNQDGPVNVSGPGTVFLLQQGGESDGSITSLRPSNNAPASELKLTRIDFQERMYSDAKSTNRITKFIGNVEVFHLPADNPDVKVDAEKLPKGGMYLRCETLTVLGRPLPDGKVSQYMTGEKQVFFRTAEFSGRADIVKFDEKDEQVKFEGRDGNLVTLWKIDGPGQPTRYIRGESILYNRKTGVFQLDRGRVLTWSN